MTQEQIRAISVAVYKVRLRQASGADAVERMLAKDEREHPGCGERMLNSRAAAYDALTRAYLQVIAGHENTVVTKVKQVDHDLLGGL